jgi:hypothetical protein
MNLLTDCAICPGVNTSQSVVRYKGCQLYNPSESDAAL